MHLDRQSSPGSDPVASSAEPNTLFSKVLDFAVFCRYVPAHLPGMPAVAPDAP